MTPSTMLGGGDINRRNDERQQQQQRKKSKMAKIKSATVLFVLFVFLVLLSEDYFMPDDYTRNLIAEESANVAKQQQPQQQILSPANNNNPKRRRTKQQQEEDRVLIQKVVQNVEESIQSVRTAFEEGKEEVENVLERVIREDHNDKRKKKQRRRREQEPLSYMPPEQQQQQPILYEPQQPQPVEPYYDPANPLPSDPNNPFSIGSPLFQIATNENLTTSLADPRLHQIHDVDTHTVRNALGFNILIFVFLIALYEIMRKVFPEVYATRKMHVPADRMVVDVPTESTSLPLSWIPSIYNTNWTQVKQAGGLDAYVFLRYIKMCLQITAISGLWGIVILWPTYASGGEEYEEGGWYHFSMANVARGNWRLWIPTVFMWLQTFYVMFLMNEEYKHYLECRMEFLAKGDNDVHPQHQYSLMVERIPHELRSDKALFNYFDALFPGKVHSACVVLNLPNLEALSARRKRVLRRLEKAIAYHEASGRRMTHVVGRHRIRCFGIESMPIIPFGGKMLSNEDQRDESRLPQRGERVDSITYYTRDLVSMNEQIAQIQAEKKAIAEKGDDGVPASQWISHALSVASDAAATTWSGGKEKEDGLIHNWACKNAVRRTIWSILRSLGMDFVIGGFSFMHQNIDVVVESVVGTTMSSTGFVTFKDLHTVTCGAKAPLSNDPRVLNAAIAPDPRDIKWENAHINVAWSAGREWTANVGLGVGAILWSIPVAAIQAWATADSLASIPGFEWIMSFDGGEFASLVNGYLPVVALLAIILLLPIIFEWIAVNYELRKTHSDVEKSILTRYFYYQLANIYITVTAGSIWTSLSDILDHPGNVFAILGKSLPTVVGYFVTLLMTKVLAGLPLVMLRLGALSRLLFLKICFRSKYLTQSELDEVNRKQMLYYGWEYPSQLLVITICFTYSCISPIILPVGAIFFLGALLVYKKQVLVVYSPTYESGGTMFPAACHRTLMGLVCGQVTLIGYSILKQGFYQPLFLLPLLVFTIGMMGVFKKLYAEPGRQLSIEKALDLDRVSTAVEAFRKDVYRQPVLAEGSAEPQPYRESTATDLNIPSTLGRSKLFEQETESESGKFV